MKLKTPLTSLCFIVAGLLSAQKPSELMHTYSIVARDSVSGEMGVAVQSHWFGVGTVCPWAEAGVGAVATQAFVNATYGPNGLQKLRANMAPEQIVKELTANDEMQAFRQLGLINNHGKTAGFSGEKCIEEACQIMGDNYVVQANMMVNKGVCKAMAKAFEKTEGKLSDRMMAALLAAQQAGGDIRGKQSAAMKVVSGTKTGDPIKDMIVDIRVDDDRAPLRELQRLLRVNGAYRLMAESDDAITAGNIAKSMELLTEAQRILPQNLEIKFWTGVNQLNNNNPTDAVKTLRPIFLKDRNWETLLYRLKKPGLLTATDKTMEAFKTQMGALPPPMETIRINSDAPVTE